MTLVETITPIQKLTSPAVGVIRNLSSSRSVASTHDHHEELQLSHLPQGSEDKSTPNLGVKRSRWREEIQFSVLCWTLFAAGWNDGKLIDNRLCTCPTRPYSQVPLDRYCRQSNNILG